jgi:glutamate formiminotransferase
LLIECVPNFSEGRDADVIERIRASIAAHARVLHVTSDRDHNRSVITFAGSPEAVERAAVEAARVAIESIDLRTHRGIHPRIGAIDVIPFVPVSEARLEDCAVIAKRVAHELWRRFGLPSFLYEAAAFGRGLEEVRRAAAAGSPPDVGEGLHPTAGAAAIGARKFLVAWNVLLNSNDLSLARKIARTIRYSSGGFPGVKALGLPLEERDCVQVSINSTDFEATPLQEVFDAVAQQCREMGVGIQGAELIGLIPQKALAGTSLPWLNFEPRMVLETALRIE